jgi:hypothetical protein
MLDSRRTFPAPLAIMRLSASGELPPSPILEQLDSEKTRTLLHIAKSVREGGRVLVHFLDTHRAVARVAGIESLAVELSGVIDSRRLDSVVDTLEEAASQGKPADISTEGLFYLKRAEKLLAEANAELMSYTGSMPDERFLVESRRGGAALGASIGQAGQQNNTPIIVALVVAGIVVIALALK